RTIDQRITTRANDRAHRRRANHFPEAQRPETRGKHLSIRRRAPVLQDNLRPEISGEWPARGFDAAGPPDFVFALHQNRQQLLFDVTAAVPTLIDDHRFLVAELANLLLELSQARRVHRPNVNVADAAI